jgi:hypothetical protein
VTLAACAALIGPFGTTGAAIANLVAELSIGAFLLHRFRGQIGAIVVPWGRIARVVAATAAMAGLLALLPGGWPVLARIALAAALYTAAVAGLGAVRPSEVRALAARR